MPCGKNRAPRKTVGGKAARKKLPSKPPRKVTEDAEEEVDKPELESAEAEAIDGVSIHEEESSAKPIDEPSEAKASVNASDMKEKSKGKAKPKSSESKSLKKTPDTKKKVKAKPWHPRTSDMIVEAVQSLKDRKGSTLQAIKNYMAATYNVDPKKLAFLIRKNMLEAVDSGVLIRLDGTGLQGHFKLNKESLVKSDSSSKKKAATAPKEKATKTASKKVPPKKAAAEKPASKKKVDKVPATKSQKPAAKPKTGKAKSAAKPKSKK